MSTVVTVGARRTPQSSKYTLLAAANAVTMLAVNILAGPPSAHAQEATVPDTAQTSKVDSLQEVTVTGTAIIRNGYQSPTPLTVLGAEDISRDAPTNIADSVNKLPQFSNSPSGSNSSTSVSDSNAGASNLNLRSLGPNRTLVLLDGMRIVPSSITGFYNNGGAVDTNSFPDALIKRVDVVAGGASAVYGDDALAGVVNFVLDRTFTGVKSTVEGGITDYGDNARSMASLTAGTGFADDRGHILFSGQLTHDNEIPISDTKRTWLQDGYGQVGNPNYTATNGQPFYIIGPRIGLSVYTPGGLISGGPLQGIDFGPGGSTRQFNYGINDGYYMQGGDWRETLGPAGGSVGTQASLASGLTRENAFSRLSYDVTDDVELFAQFMYSHTHTRGSGLVAEAGTTITSDNPFIPAPVLAQMTALGITSFPLTQALSDAIGVAGADNTRELNQYVLGANGKFDAFSTGWSWDGYLERSISRLSGHTFDNLNQNNYALATDVVTNPANGQPICRSTLTNPNNGCVPFNPMGLGVNNPAALAYLSGDGSYLNQKLQEDDLGLTLRGEPVSTWAGPVSVALGFVHRKQSVDGDADDVSAADEWYVGNYHPTFGSYHVNEGSFETVIPLAKDIFLAKTLELNGAVRRTDYSTSGGVTTWKVGVNYQPVSDLRFRATRSRDIRAPNMGDLFSAGQTSTGTVLDPFHGNARVPEKLDLTGNSSLSPEAADTTGAGVVFQPSWLPRFNMSFDYYRIDISGTITNFNEQQEIDACYNGNTSLCPLINRDAAGNITTIVVKPVNASFAATRGFDIEAGYTQPLSDIVDSWIGNLSVRALGTRVLELKTGQPDGTVVDGLGVYSGLMFPNPTAPKWRYSMTVAYDTEPFTAAWTGRGFSAGIQDSQYIQCTSGCPAVVGTAYTVNNNQLPAEFEMDLSFTYHVKKGPMDSDLFFVVDNIANWQPTGIAFLSYTPGYYDILGRTYRAGIRFKL